MIVPFNVGKLYWFAEKMEAVMLDGNDFQFDSSAYTVVNKYELKRIQQHTKNIAKIVPKLLLDENIPEPAKEVLSQILELERQIDILI